MPSRLWVRLLGVVLLSGLLLSLLAVSAVQGAREAKATEPTIALDKTQGVKLSVVTMSGAGVAPHSTVTLWWQTERQTRLAGVVDISAETNYTYTLRTRVPENVSVGETIHACITDDPQESPTICTPFEIQAATPASVTGQISLSALTGADTPTVVLYDRVDSIQRYTATVETDGTFAIPNVKPDSYQADVTGILSQSVGWDRFTRVPRRRPDQRHHTRRRRRGCSRMRQRPHHGLARLADPHRHGQIG